MEEASAIGVVYTTGYDALFAGTKKNRPPINENSKVLIIGASGGTGTPGNFFQIENWPLDDFILTICRRKRHQTT